MVQTLADIPNSQARRNELHHRLKHLGQSDRIQLLCLALDDPYPPIRHDVAEALQRELNWSDGPGDSTADALTRFLEAMAVGRTPAHEVNAALRVPAGLVPDESARARMAACVALEASPYPERTADVLAPLLDADDPDLRYQTLIATHRLAPGSSRTFDAVVEALGDEDAEIVVVATQIAVKNRWAKLMEAILEARERLGGEDRIQVTFSIGALIETASLSPDQLPPQTRADMVDECVRSLEHEPHLAAAAKTLARLDADEAADKLVTVTKKWFAHPILKVEAAAALVDLDHPRGEKYIAKSLQSRRKDARGYALRIVGTRRLQRFFSHLVDVATDDLYHSDTATLALADYGGDDARAVLKQLADSHSDPEVRKLAAAALDNRLHEEVFGPAGPARQLDPASFDATLDGSTRTL